MSTNREPSWKIRRQVLTYDFIIKEIWDQTCKMTIGSCGSTWQISGGRWKITRHSLSIIFTEVGVGIGS